MDRLLQIFFLYFFFNVLSLYLTPRGYVYRLCSVVWASLDWSVITYRDCVCVTGCSWCWEYRSRIIRRQCLEFNRNEDPLKLVSGIFFWALQIKIRISWLPPYFKDTALSDMYLFWFVFEGCEYEKRTIFKYFRMYFVSFCFWKKQVNKSQLTRLTETRNGKTNSLPKAIHTL